jgi:hypothetical protein
MVEDVHVRFDTGGGVDAVSKIRSVLDQLKLVPELEPNESPNGGVLVLIYQQSWCATAEAALRDALVARGLPGTFTVEATSSHGFL